jgi:serine protease Do
MCEKKSILILTLFVGVFAGILIGKYHESRSASAENEPENKTSDLQKELSEIKDASQYFIKIAELVKPSVVNISTLKTLNMTYENEFFPLFSRRIPRRQQQQVGSGVIVNKEGFILTNNHVVAGADEIKVILFDKREFKGKVIGRDETTDLAVVKIIANNLVPAALGDSDKIKIGEWVVAIGSPFGLEQTVTSGIVSARRETAATGGYDFIQTDAAINPGNSGGPLVNLKGEVIGINSSILSQSGGYQGIGFAIPSSRAKKIMIQLVESGKVKRPFLGVQTSDINESLAHYYDLRNLTELLKELKVKSATGAFVITVIESSPAAKSDIVEGDIIIKFNDTQIKTPNDLISSINKSQIDESVTLTIIRNGKEQAVKVKIGERS